MNFKKILILPLTLTFALTSLTSCNSFYQALDNMLGGSEPPIVDNNNNNNSNEQNNNEQNNNTNNDSNSENNNQSNNENNNVVSKSLTLQNISEFDNAFLIKHVSNDMGVLEENVSITNNNWKNEIKTDDLGLKSVNVVFNVKINETENKIYSLKLDLTLINDDLTFKIETSKSSLTFNSTDKIKESDILTHFKAYNGKGEEISVDFSVEDFANIDFTSSKLLYITVRGTHKITGEVKTKTITVNILQKCSVKYMCEGKLLKEYTINKGESVKYDGITPTKESTELTDFKFIGWDLSEGVINKNTVYNAKFEEIKTRYKVTLIDISTKKEYSFIKNTNLNYSYSDLKSQIDYSESWQTLKIYEKEDKTGELQYFNDKNGDATYYFELTNEINIGYKIIVEETGEEIYMSGYECSSIECAYDVVMRILYDYDMSYCSPYERTSLSYASINAFDYTADELTYETFSRYDEIEIYIKFIPA